MRPSGAGELVRQIRTRRGLSQRQLAVRAGTGQANISRIERGLEQVTVSRLEQLLAAMGEQLVVDSRPLDWHGDREDLRAEARLSPSRRLREGIEFARFASGLTTDLDSDQDE